MNKRLEDKKRHSSSSSLLSYKIRDTVKAHIFKNYDLNSLVDEVSGFLSESNFISVVSTNLIETEHEYKMIVFFEILDEKR